MPIASVGLQLSAAARGRGGGGLVQRTCARGSVCTWERVHVGACAGHVCVWEIFVRNTC